MKYITGVGLSNMKYGSSCSFKFQVANFTLDIRTNLVPHSSLKLQYHYLTKKTLKKFYERF